jgi:hypothetical protein
VLSHKTTARSTIVDQFNDICPYLKMNESFTNRQNVDEGYNGANNWPIGSSVPGDVSNIGILEDQIGVGYHWWQWTAQITYVPTPVGPDAPGSWLKVFYSTQHYKAGSHVTAGGFEIDSHYLMMYRGRARITQQLPQ